MLSMDPMSSDQAGYYLGLAKEDYYLEGGEPPGQWFGAGAKQLDLEGFVKPDQLYNLFDGMSPDGKVTLAKRNMRSTGAAHLPGWDLTFSAPKSVSVFWSQADEDVRQVVQAAQAAAVEAALGFLQDTAMFTRRGRDGERMEKVGMVAALFEHSTSRALDPHLHTHALVMNVSFREDGSKGAASAMHLFESKMAAGALYRVELANQLEQRLGLPIKREGWGFEIAGVSEDLMDFFSKRREAIVGELERTGLSSAEAAAVAAIETREAKVDISRPQLFESWHDSGDLYGWNRFDAEDLRDMAKPRKEHEKEPGWALDRATDRLTKHAAHFTFQDFARVYAEESQGCGYGLKDAVEHVTKHLALSPDIVRLGEFDGRLRYTTKDMYELEAELLDDAKALHESDKHNVPAQSVARSLSKLPGLSEEQMKAVFHLTHDSGDIAILTGIAGTGKTTTLKGAKEVWEAAGYRVIGTSLYSRAATQLEESSGIKSTSVSQLLYDIDPESYWETLPEAESSFKQRYGPDVSVPFRKLAKLYGPDILEPLKNAVDHYGTDIVGRLSDFAEKHGPNILEPFQQFAESYGPDIGEVWRSLGDYLTKELERIRVGPINGRTVLVLDEAGTVATPQMADLANACRRFGGKFVLAGDVTQTQPIGPGAPLATLAETHGSAELHEVFRIKEKWEKEAIRKISAGKAREVIAEYVEHGRVSISETPKDAVSQLITDWEADGMALKDCLILAGTNKDVQKLNKLAQQVRDANGHLGEDSLSHGGYEFHVNDKVMFTKGSKTRGIENRSCATVLQADEGAQTLRLKLDNGRKLSVNLKEFGDVTLGYATTTHVAQGLTVDKAYVLMTSAGQDRELSHVQLSRAAESTRIYTTMEIAGDDLGQLALRMERSNQKQMAHALSDSPKMKQNLKPGLRQ